MAEEVGARGAVRYPTLLADFLHSGTLAAGTKWDGTAYKPEKSQVAEVVYMEIFSPVKADGTKEDLRQVIPVIDGAGIEEYISLSGRYETNMMPARVNLLGGVSPLVDRTLIAFGTPGVASIFANTTLKAKDSISVRCFAGATDVTADFRVRFYGYLYDSAAELREVFGDTVYGTEERIADVNRGIELPVTKSEVEVGIDTWNEMVGGVKQDKPEIMPFMRYAYNAKATTASVPYEFNYEAADVANTWENLFFDYGVSDALYVKYIGVKTVSNLKYLGVKLGDKAYPKPDMFRVDYPSNPFNFGHAYPLIPADFPGFLPVPALPLGYLIHNEKGRLIVQDNGTSISANSIVAALGGIKISL